MVWGREGESERERERERESSTTNSSTANGSILIDSFSLHSSGHIACNV